MTSACSPAAFAARRCAEFLQPCVRCVRRAPLNGAVQGDHTLAERRQFGAAIDISAGVRNGDRLLEHRIEHRKELPRALVRHVQRARGGGERPQAPDLFEQYHLAGSKAVHAEIDADSEPG